MLLLPSLKWCRRPLMMLARRFNPLRLSAVRSGASTLHAAYAQFFIPSRDLLPFKPSHPAAGCRSPRGMVWRLVLLGFFCGVLTLSLQDGTRSVAGEATGPLRIMALASEVSLVPNRAE